MNLVVGNLYITSREDIGLLTVRGVLKNWSLLKLKIPFLILEIIQEVTNDEKLTTYDAKIIQNNKIGWILLAAHLTNVVGIKLWKL